MLDDRRYKKLLNWVLQIEEGKDVYNKESGKKKSSAEMNVRDVSSCILYIIFGWMENSL